jgi:hypothetical protein
MLLALASTVFLGSESFGIPTIFYCLRFETSLFVAGSRWRYSTPPPHGLLLNSRMTVPFYNSGRTEERSLPPTVRVLHCFIRATKRVSIPCQRFDFYQHICCENVLAELLPTNVLFRLSGIMSQYVFLQIFRSPIVHESY